MRHTSGSELVPGNKRAKKNNQCTVIKKKKNTCLGGRSTGNTLPSDRECRRCSLSGLCMYHIVQLIAVPKWSMS